MPKFRTVHFLLLLSLLLVSCSKEQVVSKYPDGSKKETVISSGKAPNVATLKSYEYYPNGKKKREFSYKDNHFFGPWKAWYKNGIVFGEGEIKVKTLDHTAAVNAGKYYWPNGKTMVELEALPDNSKSVVRAVYSEEGLKTPPDKAPKELSDKISDTFLRWLKNEI